MNRLLPLSSLVPSRRNPRRVKPDKDAHRQLVATIRAFGVLEPLIVRPLADDGDKYHVIAGHRRLAALKDIHRGNGHGGGDVKVPCVIKDVDDVTADALSLTENFTQRAMHPLDEATAFAELAAQDASGIDAVTAKFGVTERYVKQRIKLAGLSGEVKTAYREGTIDTAIAEAFAAVPEDRQREIWREMDGQPRHAEHVRNVIAHGWIDASHALFDLATLHENSVNRDLFSEQVLVERTAFMEAQSAALSALQQELKEQGWSDALICPHQEFYGLAGNMDTLPCEYDAKTTRKVAKLEQRREKLHQAKEKIEDDENGAEAVNRIHAKLNTLEDAERELQRQGTAEFSEATKATGTVFLVLHPDGSVRREYRTARSRSGKASSNGHGDASGEEGPVASPQPPTSEEVNDRQRATSFTHHALAVREVLLENPLVCKRLLVLLLHEKVRSEALAIRHDANGVTLHASREEGFKSPAWDRLSERQGKIDALAEASVIVDDQEAYAKVSKLTATKLDALIDLLLVQSVTCHALRPTTLVQQLATELKVDVRKSWTPDAAWLACYQKCQLAHLMAELYGPAYNPATETRKKSELVEVLATLFAEAASGKLEDKKLAERVNGWLPVNLREPVEA